MYKALTVIPLCLGIVVNNAIAGTTVVDTVKQEMPPGTVNKSQILIIDNDEFGNQRILNIGHPGGTIIRSKPCIRDKPVAGMDCTDKDLRNVQWNGAKLTNSQFDGADLRGASLQNAQLENASFNNARLDKANLSGARLINCDFNSTSLSNTRLKRAEIINSDFMEADMTGAILAGANLINVEFMEARLDGATWTDGSRCRKGSVERCHR